MDHVNLEINSKLANRYILKKELGSGGMGQVFLAEDTILNGTLVAIKVLAKDTYSDNDLLTRFLKEVEISRRINHPNVVQVFDVGFDGKLAFYTMEYVEGTTLQERIKRGNLDFDSSIAYFKQIIKGLKAIHDAGIIHRDLKPSNVIIQAGGEAKIADFGIALTANESGGSTDAPAGSAEYMAPELWKGKPPTIRSDLYSAGIILYELLTGAPPFTGTTHESIMRGHLLGTIPSIDDLDLPPYIFAVLYKLLARDPENRPSSCDETLRLLNPTLANHRIKTHSYSSPSISKTGAKTMPNYTQLKKKVNPNYRSSKSNTPFKMRDYNSRFSIRRYIERSTKRRRALATLGLRIIESILGIVVVFSATFLIARYVLPVDQMARHSFSSSINIPFLFYLIACIAIFSFIFSSPAVIVSSLNRTSQGSRIVSLWLNIACVISGIITILMIERIIGATSGIRLYGFLLPSRLMNALMLSTQHVLSIGLLYPGDRIDYVSLPYACFVLYLMVLLITCQSMYSRYTTVVFLFGLISMLAVITGEQYLANSNIDIIGTLMAIPYSVEVGSYRYTINAYEIVCGLINWMFLSLYINITSIFLDE